MPPAAVPPVPALTHPGFAYVPHFVPLEAESLAAKPRCLTCTRPMAALATGLTQLAGFAFHDSVWENRISNRRCPSQLVVSKLKNSFRNDSGF